MTARTSVSFFLAAAALLLCTAAPAHADAIDGNWCKPHGKHMSIRGPNIVTPTGTQTQGDYDRHAFSYDAPPKDPDAGKKINMILVDEDTLYLRVGAAPGFGPGEAEVWNRCTLPTS
jgi:hypothetical protein